MTAAWIVALGSFALLAVIWKRNKPKFLWYVKPILAVVGAGAFAQTDWGRVVSSWIGGGLDLFTSWIGVGPSVLLGIAVLAVFVYVLLELGADKRANSGVLVLLIALPLVAGVASGPIADAVQRGYAGAADGGGRVVTRLVGG